MNFLDDNVDGTDDTGAKECRGGRKEASRSLGEGQGSVWKPPKLNFQYHQPIHIPHLSS